MHASGFGGIKDTTTVVQGFVSRYARTAAKKNNNKRAATAVESFRRVCASTQWLSLESTIGAQ